MISRLRQLFNKNNIIIAFTLFFVSISAFSTVNLQDINLLNSKFSFKTLVATMQQQSANANRRAIIYVDLPKASVPKVFVPKVFVRYLDGDKETVLVNGSTTYFVNPKWHIENQFSSANSPLFFLLTRKKMFQQKYINKIIRSKNIFKIFATYKDFKIEIVLNIKYKNKIFFIITFRQGIKMRITLMNIKYNIPIKASIFKYTPKDYN